MCPSERRRKRPGTAHTRRIEREPLSRSGTRADAFVTSKTSSFNCLDSLIVFDLRLSQRPSGSGPRIQIRLPKHRYSGTAAVLFALLAPVSVSVGVTAPAGRPVRWGRSRSCSSRPAGCAFAPQAARQALHTTGFPSLAVTSLGEPVTCSEYCDNGADDDRDGLGDSADPDCAAPLVTGT